MTTRFGPEAKDGDYVIVLDADYVHRSARNLIGKVCGNKAYTGMRQRDIRTYNFIHKKIAEIVIPESMVPEEIKEKIEEDIKFNVIPKKKEK